MPTTTKTWHTIGDDHVCPICRALNNYTWVFVTGKDVMTDALWHPIYGIVWSLAEGSNAHSRGYLSGHDNNCRCEIETQYYLEDVLAKSIFLKEMVDAIDAEIKDTQSGGRRRTTFEDIGIDPSKYGF